MRFEFFCEIQIEKVVKNSNLKRPLNFQFQITEQKLPALLSSCWYLDHLSTGGDWVKFYNCEPYDFTLKEDLRKLVLGGEACMW